ncbi:MAG: hypothetical protein ACOC2U_04765 [bacterium]
MKRKTIESIIDGKFKKWVNTIEDEDIQELVMENTIITGGCIVSMFQNDTPNDFDVYFTNKETALKVAEYYVDKYNKKYNKNIEVHETDEGRIKIYVESEGVSEVEAEKETDENDNEDETFLGLYNLELLNEMRQNELIKNKQANHNKGKYKPVFLSSNAITLTDKIQIVVRFYGSPKEIHDNFDFIHCTNYWLSSDRKLYTNTDALESILSKHLYYHGSKYPLCSIIRTRKFLQRGWHINAGQYLKMAMQLNELDLKDVGVLEDQLIGVDAAYFTMIIEDLKKQKELDENFEIDSGYVASLVDKIF